LSRFIHRLLLPVASGYSRIETRARAAHLKKPVAPLIGLLQTGGCIDASPASKNLPTVIFSQQWLLRCGAFHIGSARCAGCNHNLSRMGNRDMSGNRGIAQPFPSCHQSTKC
jgi:hypothetical protein